MFQKHYNYQTVAANISARFRHSSRLKRFWRWKVSSLIYQQQPLSTSMRGRGIFNTLHGELLSHAYESVRFSKPHHYLPNNMATLVTRTGYSNLTNRIKMPTGIRRTSKIGLIKTTFRFRLHNKSDSCFRSFEFFLTDHGSFRFL